MAATFINMSSGKNAYIITQPKDLVSNQSVYFSQKLLNISYYINLLELWVFAGITYNITHIYT